MASPHPGDTWVNVAVTDWSASMPMVQLPVPEHAPLQPANADPVTAVAVRVTVVPAAKELVHVAPQEMPAGVEFTMPVPFPVCETDNE